MKLLLDEMYPPVIAAELRGRGDDVLAVQEADPSLAGHPDSEILDVAIAGERVLVTENVRDFRPLELAIFDRGGRHGGIVYTADRSFPRGDPRTVGQLVTALDLLLRDSPALVDRSIFLRAAPDSGA